MVEIFFVLVVTVVLSHAFFLVFKGVKRERRKKEEVDIIRYVTPFIGLLTVVGFIYTNTANVTNLKKMNEDLTKVVETKFADAEHRREVDTNRLEQEIRAVWAEINRLKDHHLEHAKEHANQ